MSYAGYFDYASATPLDEGVFLEMKPYFSDMFYNPSAIYGPSIKVHEVLEQSRKSVAGVLGVKAQEIIFTAGATEANNIAIQGVMKKYPEGKVLFSAIEHDSVRETAKHYTHEEVPVSADGIISLEALDRLLDDDVVLVSVMYANNEIGTIQPLRDIRKILDEHRKKRGSAGLPLYFHTDASQAPNYLSCVVAGLGVDMMSLNGGKIYGPKASGCVYIASDVTLEPLVYGGGQERGLRSGTENVAQCVGFSHALQLAQQNHIEESHRVGELRDVLLNKLSNIHITVHGSLKKRLPNNANFSIEGQDNERLVMALDRAGVYISSGSACHAKSGEPSHVLSAIGATDEGARSSVRVSLGRFTTLSDVEKLVTLITELVAK